MIIKVPSYPNPSVILGCLMWTKSLHQLSVEEVPVEKGALAELLYFHTLLYCLSGKKYSVSFSKSLFHAACDEDSQFSQLPKHN